jgi:pyruvate kinase
MARIARLTQRDMTDHGTSAIGRVDFVTDNRYRTAALAHGVATIVRDLKACMVVTWSEQGGGAGYLSHHRLGIPILAASTRPTVLRRMALMHGVIPVQLDRPESSDAFVRDIDLLIQERGWANQGDAVVIVKGDPIGTPGVTNELRIHYVGDMCRLS